MREIMKIHKNQNCKKVRGSHILEVSCAYCKCLACQRNRDLSGRTSACRGQGDSQHVRQKSDDNVAEETSHEKQNTRHAVRAIAANYTGSRV